MTIPILATIVVLGVLIFIHELGHFMAAKAVGIEVQRFSIGLGPKIFGFQRGETEYVLSWIPLGGYVKMGGMDDEVAERLEGGASEVAREPGPRDFDAKPIWARTLVISAGVIMNMIFAFVVYAGVNAFWGMGVLDDTRVGLVAVEALPAGAEALADLEKGSRIVLAGEREVGHWGDVIDGIMEAPDGPIVIETEQPAGRFTLDVSSDPSVRHQLAGSIVWWIPSELGDIRPGSPAQDAGLERGDRVISVQGDPVDTWDQFVEFIQARPGQATELVLERDGMRLVRTVTPEAATEKDPDSGELVRIGLVGVYRPPVEVSYEPVTIAEAVALGYEETAGITVAILGFLGDLVTGGVSPREVGSIGTIAQASGQAASAGAAFFLKFMALFSVNLAILNLLPIPVLDGGHLVFLAIEAVRGKALSIEQRMRWSNVGLIVIVGIMVWALSNDVLRFLGL
jgi:regulator of sigma E protease